MTISTETTRKQYNGNDVTTEFSFPYKFLAERDLTVILTDSDGVDTTLTLTTHYTTTGEGLDAGGTVTMITPPATGERLTIVRELDLVQETDYISGDSFPSESHEKALDRITMIAQQLRELISRSVMLPKSSTVSDVVLENPVALELIRWDATGEALESIPASPGLGDLLAANNLSDLLSAPIARKNLDVIEVYDTVAEMVADTNIVVGRKVRTLGYYAAGDGGGNDYEIVAAATGTDDGGSYIDLATHQAKGVFTDGVIDVKRFGAKGDGVTDDAVALQAALNASTGNSLIVSSGDFICSTKLTKTGDPVSISGLSTVVSRIIFSSTTGGILLTLDPQGIGVPPEQVTVSNLTIESQATVSSPALELAWSGYQPNAQGQFTIEKLNITRKGDGTGSFTAGIRVKSGIVGAINNCYLVGDDSRVSSIGIDLEDCVGIRVSKCDVNRYQTGIKISKVLAVQSEGIFVVDSFIYDIDKGIDVDTAIHVNIVNSHVNINGLNASYSIKFANVSQCSIQAGCLIYFGGLLGDAANQDAIQIVSSNSVHISGTNIIGITAANTRYGIVFSGTSTLNTVTGCTVSTANGAGIFFGGAVDSLNIVSNVKFFNNTVDLADNGTSNLITGNSDETGAIVGTSTWGSVTGKFASGEISTNSHWGAFIMGYAGTSADVALVSSNGVAVTKIDQSDNFILTIPTSSAGLPTGAVWNNAGVLNIV